MFSVVIPLYNKSHTIVETLNSVFSQDFQAFEVVVVDDGSTDGGSEKIEQNFSDSRIRLIHQERQGVSTARNRGVVSARYEFIAFLDADDLLLPAYLSTMRIACEKFPDAQFYCSGGAISYPDGRGYLRCSSRFRQIGPVKFFTNPGFFAHISSTVVRKSVFCQAGGFQPEMAVNEDHAFLYKLALSGEVVYCSQLLGVYRKEVDGQVSARAATFHPDIVKRMNSVFDFWAKLNPSMRDGHFIDFALHDLSANLLAVLKQKDYLSVHSLLDEVDPRLVNRLGAAHKFLVRNPCLRIPAMIQIYLSRVAWRLRRYPRAKYQSSLPESCFPP